MKGKIVSMAIVGLLITAFLLMVPSASAADEPGVEVEDDYWTLGLDVGNIRIKVTAHTANIEVKVEINLHENFELMKNESDEYDEKFVISGSNITLTEVIKNEDDTVWFDFPFDVVDDTDGEYSVPYTVSWRNNGSSDAFQLVEEGKFTINAGTPDISDICNSTFAMAIVGILALSLIVFKRKDA